MLGEKMLPTPFVNILLYVCWKKFVVPSKHFANRMPKHLEPTDDFFYIPEIYIQPFIYPIHFILDPLIKIVYMSYGKTLANDTLCDNQEMYLPAVVDEVLISIL